MSFTDEYLALKKKKKEQAIKQIKSTGHSYTDEYQSEKTASSSETKKEDIAPLFVNKTAALFSDIAPVTKATTTTAKKDEEEDARKWFQKGAFEDGYQFGDVMKTLLGTASDVVENVGAGILGMGEKAVDAIAYVSPLIAQGQYYQNGGVYHDAQTQKLFNESIEESKKWSADFIKKDLYDEEKIAKKLVLGTDENSVLGEKSDALLQSGGQLLGTAGLQAVGVPWFLTTGATSFGSQTEAALNEQAGYEEAGLSAAISAGAEILTEKLSGGIKFGGKTLDDVLLKPLTEKIANKTVKTLVNLGVDAVGEGAEEVVSGVLSNLGTAIYKEDDVSDLLFSEQAMDEYLESFIGGAVLGGVGSGVQAIQDSKRIHLTENEQKVVEHEVEKRIADQNLTEKEKNKVRNEVVRDMLRGYISTDTIEEVLGGETYQNWKNTVDSEDALQREYDELGKKQNATLAETTRYNELHQQLNELKTTSQRNALKEQLGTEVMGLVQNERLAESYNERSRRGQAFEADLTKYDAKQQATIQKAIDSGILNNTNRTHEFVDMIAKITADKGVLFDFTNNEKLKNSGFAVDGKAVNGYVTKDGVTLNIDSAKSMNSVVGHEITHVLEGTELYQTLQNVVTEYAKGKGDYQGRYDALSKLYEGVEGADINAELTADLVGDYLFTDTDFVRNLSVQHRNVFQKIYDEIKYLCKMATAGSKEARELEKVKKVFEDAYRADGKGNTDTKYSIGEIVDTDNHSYGIGVHLNSTLLDNLTPDERKAMVRERIKELGGEVFTAYDKNGNAVDITIAKPNAHFKNQNGKKRLINHDLLEKYAGNEVKQEAVVLIDELITTSKFQGTDPAKHSHGWLDNEGQNEWDVWTTYIQDKNNTIWEATLHIANTANGEKIIYDVVPTKKVGPSRNLDTSLLADSLTQENQNVKYSLRVTDKDTLDFLDNQETVTTYKTMQLVDGKLYPPMASRIEGKFEDYSELGAWEQATEHPELIKNGNKFKLDKGKGQGSIEAAYNPYMHSSNLVLNDQFSGAYKRDNLVTVECEVPVSELTSGYHAEFAKDSVGWHPWHTGTVAGQLRNAKGTERQVLLSRWIKPVRIVPDAEVAAKYKELLEGTDIEVPDNVVTPALLEELKNAGVKIKESGRVKYSLTDSEGVELSEEQQEYFKNSVVRDENGNLKVMYHGTPNGDFTVFKDGTYFTDNKDYAAGYQNPNASMLRSNKAATNPKIFEVYLNIKKPFDISDAEARDIYINEYIKGGNALGINPYLSDAEYAKIKTIDWTEGEDLREFLIDNEYDYDGLVLDEGAVGGYGDEVSYRGKSYVVFSPEQVKNVDNQAPTADKDIRFSLSEPVEQSKNLVAVHNLTPEKLTKSLALGGLPMPSIAILKAQDGHGDFGDISLVFGRDTVDPKAYRTNKIYSGDAWTPTYPNIEYKPSDKVLKAVKNKISGLVPYEVQNALGNLMFDTDNARDTLNRYNGNMAEAYKRDDAMKYAYLKDTGSNITLPAKETDLYAYGGISNDAVRYFSGKLTNGLQTVEHYQNMGARAMMQDEALKEAIADAMNWDVLRTMEPGSADYTEYENNPVFLAENISFSEIDKMLTATRKLFTRGVQQTVDVKAAKDLIRDSVDQTAYENWLNDLFDGVVEKEGIRNNKDLFTPSGNRRSFEALHYEHNLENVIKAMREKGNKGLGGFGNGNIFGASTQEFSSIEQMKQSDDRLQHLSDEEFEEIKKGFSDRFFEIASSLPNDKNSFIATNDAANMLIEAVTKYSTKSGMANYLRRESQGWATYSDAVVDDLMALVNDIRSMPTGYFEAKPQRAVGFDEVEAVLVPDNLSEELSSELARWGFNVVTYEAGNDADRAAKLNELEDLKFSLSNVGEDIANDDSLSALKLEAAPVSETAPVQNEVVAKNATVEENLFPDDTYAPIADDPERFDSLDDRDMPPEVEAPYSEEEDIYVDDPFEDRDFFEVGNRKVKAYMYENPEVKPFFQEEALKLGGELSDTIKAERWYNDDVYYESGGTKGFGGNKRYTSESIATLLDDWGMSYADIEKGINAIIEDNGAENIAAAKKIEFMLNDRLMNGYKNFYEHGYVEPNAAYLDLIYEKQINEYSKEAFDAFMANADQYAPPAVEDIAPVAPVSKPVQSVAMKAPVAEKYEAIKPKPTKEPRLAKATPAEQARAQVLTEEPKVDPKKPKAWNLFKDNIVDKGTVFETLSLKTGNRELQAKWKSIGRAESSAQWFMEHGNAETSSLKSIRDTVEKSGKTQKFYEYLYHMHNVDRMNLEERYDDVENKPVFGYGVTSDISKAEAAKLEKANPEFKQWANSVYSYMTNLREMMVDNGVISRETSDLWAEMYPHYVPVRRMGDEGLNINVALDSKKTGINAPVKRATGGNRDILPLFDTMAMRTEQTFKAIAKNRFGVELKNMLGTTIDTGSVTVDEMIESVDQQDSLLQEGKDGGRPTFTVFENGERVTFEITDEMYDTMKPKNKGYAEFDKSRLGKTLNTANNIRRGLLTEYNPAFMLTNPIKDTQDVLMNSQHPARTYANYPKAIAELAGRKGKYYQEYMEHGGEQNTFFDGETKTFKEQSTLRKVVGFPLDKISDINNFIERVPRMAEYIASRKMGRSIDVSMLDAARVTTDFSAGGDFVKALNRNGFTFLNASVQGAVQQVRNVREAKAEGLKGWAKLAAKTAVAGLSAELLNHLLWEDDEDYEDLSDYVKQNYYVVAKYDDGKFVRIPKGRTVAVIQDAFEQMKNLITGDDETDFGAFAELVISNLAPNNPLENNLIAPIGQAISNKTWYGDDLVPSRLQELPAAEQYDETTDELSKWLGEKLNISPYKINYVLDQYSGAVGDMFLPMMTQEAERGDDSLLGNIIAPISDKFTTDSVLKNQNVSDFYTKKDELTVNANASGATDEDVLMSKYMNSVNTGLAKLYAAKRELQNSDMPDAEKYEAVRDIQQQIVDLTKEALGSYDDITFEDDYREGGEYARMNGRLYKLNEDGEWQKLSDEQVTKYEVTKAAGDASYATDGTNHYRWYEPGEDAGKDAEAGWKKITEKELERQEEVTSGLGITATQYWDNKEEYSYAYDYPENYSVAKAVGGYKDYKVYSGELYDIKADKDEYGKSISGSRKAKVLDYINNLDADYYTKIILWKSEYTSDDTYNHEIIDYLNGREDITFDDMVNILRKLGFNVTDDGDISW